MKLKCIIIDDEQIARQIIETYCNHIDWLEVVSSCSNALHAKSFIETHDVDIAFLDINMPVLDGIAFLKTLRLPPQVIFTTAYKEYAVEAFDLNACDYLLKPFSFERFIQAVDKAREKITKTSSQLQIATESFTYLRADGKIFKIDLEDLQYAEANGNYVKVVLDDGQFTTAMTFNSFEDLLPKSKFIRVHRSFIVNKSKIRIIEGNRIMMKETEIPIGANYRDDFFKTIRIK